MAKQTKLPFPYSDNVSLNCFDLLHMDILGPIRTHSLDGYKYFLTMVDDLSCFMWIFLMKREAAIKPALENFKICFFTILD